MKTFTSTDGRHTMGLELTKDELDILFKILSKTRTSGISKQDKIYVERIMLALNKEELRKFAI